MARVIWVEIVTRGGLVTARHRCAGPELRIGRSYRNDVIIDDPTVAPDHLRITQSDDGAILIEATSDSAFTIRGERRERSLVDGDTVLRIGHTSLRIRDETYAVPAAAMVVEPKPRWIELSVLIVVALLINGLTLWLNEIAEPKFSRYVVGMVGLGAAVLLWSGLWALISRIFGGAARFPRHLGIAAGAFLVYTIYTILAEALAFTLSSGTIAGNVTAGLWVVFGIACFLHLQVIAPTHAPIKAGIIAVLVVAGIAAQLANRFEQLRNGAQPSIAQTNFPPAFRLAHAESEDQFFAAVDSLREKLEADRKAGAAAP
jgi:Inner membrane component of T3SS, cytoplasmic domain